MKLSLSRVCLNDFDFHSLFRLWRFGILNDFETIWDRFSGANLNWAVRVKRWPVSHPQTLHSMKVTQTFRNVFIHQNSGYAELYLLRSLSEVKILVTLFFTEILIFLCYSTIYILIFVRVQTPSSCNLWKRECLIMLQFIINRVTCLDIMHLY